MNFPDRGEEGYRKLLPSSFSDPGEGVTSGYYHFAADFVIDLLYKMSLLRKISQNGMFPYRN